MVCRKLLQRIVPHSQLSADSPVQVSEEARRRITEALEESLAPTTRINYISQWRKWERFAVGNGYGVFPSDPVHLADWITQRAADGQKPGTIRMGLAAVGSAIARPIFQPCRGRGCSSDPAWNYQSRRQGAEASCRTDRCEPCRDTRDGLCPSNRAWRLPRDYRDSGGKGSGRHRAYLADEGRDAQALRSGESDLGRPR